MREQVFGQIDQHAIAAHADDRLMELDIHLGIFVEMRAELAVLEGREHLPQRGDVSSIAFCVIRRAAMLSSAAQAVISSITSSLVLRTT